MTSRLNLWLLILLALCAFSLWFGKDLIRPPARSADPEPAAPEAAADFALAKDEAPIHLVVLNGTEKAGLAREVSMLLGGVGCLAESVGNAPDRSIARCLLINRRLDDRRAADLGRRLGGIRVMREADDRTGEDAVLVLGGDWARLMAVLTGD